MTNLFNLSGRVAVVSGAAQGLGRAMALALADAGADLALVDLNESKLGDTVNDVRAIGPKAVPYLCNVSQPEAIRGLFSQIDNDFGRVDVLGNVAGDGILGKPEDIPIEDVQKVMQNLVIGRFCMCQEAGRRMLKAGKGSIINIGSLASLTALGRGHIAYSMAMGAVVQMTRELSTEWSSAGVRVNAILPAQVTNPSLETRMAADPNLRATYLRGLPIGRLGEPNDIQGLSIFLASDASQWITGALIPMDGGNLALNGGGTVRPPVKA